MQFYAPVIHVTLCQVYVNELNIIYLHSTLPSKICFLYLLTSYLCWIYLIFKSDVFLIELTTYDTTAGNQDPKLYSYQQKNTYAVSGTETTSNYSILKVVSKYHLPHLVCISTIIYSMVSERIILFSQPTEWKFRLK